MLHKIFSSLSPVSYIVFLLPGKLLVYRVKSSLILPRSREEVLSYELGSETSLQSLLSHIKKTCKPKVDDQWYVGLPLKYFSIINFSLPKAAEANFEQAARYALMRHVPYDLSSLYIHYHLLSEDHTLEIAALTAQKNPLSPVLNAFEAAGITLTAIFPSLAFWAMHEQHNGIYFSGGSVETEMLIWKEGRIPLQIWNSNDSPESGVDFLRQSRQLLENVPELPSRLYLWESDVSASSVAESLGLKLAQSKDLSETAAQDIQKPASLPYAIDMLPRSVVKKKRIASRVQLAAVVFFAFALLLFPISKLAGKKSYLSSIELKINQVESRADKLSRLREKNQQLVDYFKRIAEKEDTRQAAVEVLKEATEIVPDSAWLYSFSYDQQKIYLQGEADSATAILEALENSPLFQEVQFDSPVKKSGSQDRFKIVAKVVQ